MKSIKLFFNFINKGRKGAYLLLTLSSLTLSAQTIQQKTTITGNAVTPMNGVISINKAIDVISLDETRVITTTRKTNASYELIAWEVSSSAITQKGALVVSGMANGIRSAKLSNTRFANAYTRNNKLYLEVWDVSSTGGTFTLKGTKTGEDIKSDYHDFALIALSSSRLVSISVSADERLTFTTLDVASNGTITQAASSVWGGETTGFSPAITLSSTKFVVAYSFFDSSDRTHLFQVNAAGVLTLLDSYASVKYDGGRLVPLTSNRFAAVGSTGIVGDDNNYLVTWSISASNELNIGNSAASLVQSIDGSITKLNSSNVLSADISMATGKLTLSHGKIASDNTPSKKYELVSSFTGKQPRATTLLANTTLSRVVTGMITTDNKLRLTTWDVTIGTPIPRNANDIESTTEEQEQLSVYPNPAATEAIFTFSMDENAQASLKIYNALGEMMSEVANGNFSKGAHQITFPVENLASGVYYYSLETGGKQTMNKLMIQH